MRNINVGIIISKFTVGYNSLLFINTAKVRNLAQNVEVGMTYESKLGYVLLIMHAEQ